MDDAAKRVGLARATGRALLLRCPRCGARGILDGWFKLKANCRVCGLGLRRSPEDDEWFGGYFVNLCTSELLMLVVVMAYVASEWPAVPWDTVWVLAVVMVIASPIISYPFSKSLWVALDFVIADRAEARSRRR